jgi:hypothetical protein
MNYKDLTIKEKKDLTKLAIDTKDFSISDNIIDAKLEQIKENGAFAGFDFEFAQIDGKKEIVEVGIATYDSSTKITTAKHFLITGMKEKMNRPSTPIEHTDMFAYGKSKECSLAEALYELKNTSDKFNMFSFTPADRVKFLKKNNMEDFRFINVAQLVQLKTFSKGTPALSDTISSLENPKEVAINNAGNDAMSTLEILSASFGNKLDFNNFKPFILFDYSTHSKMKSGEQIQKDRSKNKTIKKIINKPNLTY